MAKLSLVVVPVLLLPLLLGGNAAAEEVLTPAAVFERALTSEKARVQFLQLHAGQAVSGVGHLEATMPRAYFDTSVPDSNLAVALIQLEGTRKVACGLLRPLQRETFGAIVEGMRLAFRGELADAQDWGQWQTLYLGNCTLRQLPATAESSLVADPEGQ